MTSNLLPCPFCGCSKIKVHYKNEPYHAVEEIDSVECTNPDCHAEIAMEERSVEAWNRRTAALSVEQEPATVKYDTAIATVSDHNAAFDPADDAFGGAFKDGFREGWLFAKNPDWEDREEFEEDYRRSVDMAPTECWDAYRSQYFAMLPLAAIPEVGAPLPPTPVSSPARDEEIERLKVDETIISDTIRSAYDCGYNDARNAYNTVRDNAKGYRGRDKSEEISSDLLARLRRLSDRSVSGDAVRVNPEPDPDPLVMPDWDVIGQAAEEWLIEDAPKDRGDLSMVTAFKDGVAWMRARVHLRSALVTADRTDDGRDELIMELARTLRRLCDYSDAHYVPNVLFDKAKAALTLASEAGFNDGGEK